MIIEKIVGNLSENSFGAPHTERVYLSSDELVKRILRVKTDHGRDIGIRLREPKDLQNGDVLHVDEKNMIVISVIEDDVLTILPESIGQMGEIAHQLGNRHLPAQFEGDEMIVQYDYLVEDLLQQMNVPYKREKRQMQKAFRHIGHSHD